MKKFIYNIFCFLIIVLVFNAFVFIFAKDNYYKNYGTFPSKNYSSFIMADSHGLPLNNFAEKFNVYNFSAASESYLDMKRKILYLIENGYNVDKIYITVDDHSLSPYRENMNNTDKSIVFTSDFDFNYLKDRYLKYYFPIFQDKVNPLLKIYLKSRVKNFYQRKSGKPNTNVWAKLSEKEKQRKAKSRMVWQFSSKNKSQQLEDTLLEIIKLCKANNIELIGIKFPLSGDYLKILGNRNYGADKLFISNGLKIIDGRTMFMNQEEYFGDQDHLNPQGGKEFVKILFK